LKRTIAAARSGWNERMHWTLDQLRKFVATADCGSFSVAARQLGKAQSAVSTAIGLLEADLGLELFDRSRWRWTRRCHMPPSARSCARCRRAFQTWSSPC
jgi:DNA-binding transcriptional LysR family regulator